MRSQLSLLLEWGDGLWWGFSSLSKGVKRAENMLVAVLHVICCSRVSWFDTQGICVLTVQYLNIKFCSKWVHNQWGATIKDNSLWVTYHRHLKITALVVVPSEDNWSSWNKFSDRELPFLPFHLAAHVSCLQHTHTCTHTHTHAHMHTHTHTHACTHAYTHTHTHTHTHAHT